MVQTRGKVHQNPNAIRFVDRSAYIGRFVPRKSGVNRNSANVYAINQKFAAANSGENGCPAQAGGQDWFHFVAALKACMSKKDGFTSGVSKSPAYHYRFNKYVKAPKTATAGAAGV